MMNLSAYRPLVLLCPLFFSAYSYAEKGFIDDSHLLITSRSTVLNSQMKGDGHHRFAHDRRDPRDVSLGMRANFASGFTQGVVGVGLDAYGFSGFKLDGGDGHAGYGNIQMNHEGEAQRSFGRAGVLMKAKYGLTEMRYGQMQVTNPVFATSDTRLFPSTATGILLSNRDVEGLLLETGRFTAGTEPSSTSNKGELWANYAFVPTDSVSFAGGRYDHQQWGVSAYVAEFEDLWRQAYLGGNYLWELVDRSRFALDVNLYHTRDEGRANAGDIRTTAYSSQVSYAFGRHRLAIAYQRIIGDTPFDYIGFGNNGSGAFGNSIYLSNPIMASDFNGPNEKSWQLRYDLDMAASGFPGLSFMARYVFGYDIQSSGNSHYGAWNSADDAQHQELDLEARYVVQSGVAKDLRIRLREGIHDAKRGQPDGDVNMHMLIFELPINYF